MGAEGLGAEGADSTDSFPFHCQWRPGGFSFSWLIKPMPGQSMFSLKCK